MDDTSIAEKLKHVDEELHSIIEALGKSTLPDSSKHVKSLSELNKLMERDRISDEDSTELIRGMRDKEYA